MIFEYKGVYSNICLCLTCRFLWAVAIKTPSKVWPPSKLSRYWTEDVFSTGETVSRMVAHIPNNLWSRYQDSGTKHLRYLLDSWMGEDYQYVAGRKKFVYMPRLVFCQSMDSQVHKDHIKAGLHQCRRSRCRCRKVNSTSGSGSCKLRLDLGLVLMFWVISEKLRKGKILISIFVLVRGNIRGKCLLLILI